MERAPGSLWFCFPPSVPLPPPIHPVWFCCCFCTRSQEGWAYETKLQFSSVAQSCPTLCDPVDCSMPGFPIHHQLPEFTQNHGHQVILRPSAFFIVQLSHPYMTTEKTKAFTRRTFVGKVMSLLFNMLSRLALDFLPRSKHLGKV